MIFNAGLGRKSFVIMVLGFWLLHAAQVEIIADQFEVDQQKHVSLFQGNVSILKEQDILKAKKVTVHTDASNRPLSYVAEGNVTFSITAQGSDTYNGSAQKMIFDPNANTYTLYTNVKVTQKADGHTITGDAVFIDVASGTTKVLGRPKEPIRIIFDLGPQ